MIQSAAMGFFPKGLENEFERAVVNEPSVFEPLQIYCIFLECLRQAKFLMDLALIHRVFLVLFVGYLWNQWTEDFHHRRRKIKNIGGGSGGGVAWGAKFPAGT